VLKFASREQKSRGAAASSIWVPTLTATSNEAPKALRATSTWEIRALILLPDVRKSTFDEEPKSTRSQAGGIWPWGRPRPGA